jgi:hypothetical protein
MNKNLITLLISLLLTTVIVNGQTNAPVTCNSIVNDEEILNNFIIPPEGYGEVPFYWWQGDSLTKERISWQLDRLSDKGISSLQINYSHRDFGGLTYGLSNPSKPPLFSPAWWDLFSWFASEAGKHGMTVSLSDYTIGVGQGFAMDEAIHDIPALNGSILNYRIFYVSGKKTLDLPAGLLTLKSYRMNRDSTVIPGTRTDLLPEVRNGRLTRNFGKAETMVIAVFPEKVLPSFDPMNPESGKAYNKYFFSRFEDALPGKGKGMLNFFFSDELNFRLSGNLWDSLFADEFRKRKGYDITSCLDALFVNGDPAAPKIRLDYNDVIVSLSEENFFEPVYKWHQERGLTFGCDHGGRGRDVTEFGDYFRTQKWNQGPGSDQPRLSKDVIKAKVASSIAHLYKRPRVWLEGFHSSGWGTSSADVTDAIFANFTAGYNLLSFHGLYYSTMGGWWEWAPPDNHFRMPYWNQIDPLMNCVQRISYLLSAGYHNCDVAILYPTEPVVTGLDGDTSVNLAFETGEELYSRGIDFDFIDYESVARSTIGKGELQVSDERYKILIVPSMRAIRYTTLEKLREFENAGGVVVNIGIVPEANDRTGMNNKDANLLAGEVFGPNSRVVQCNKVSEINERIRNKYTPGFSILSPVTERPYVMHRIIGSRDVYFLYNIPEKTKCRFNTTGAAQLWDPWTGKEYRISDYTADAQGTEIYLPLGSKDLQIIVFDHGQAQPAPELARKVTSREIDLGNTWNFTLKPALDNTWGDFELPAKNEKLGASVTQLHLADVNNYSGGPLNLEKNNEKITCGYGPHFLLAGPLKNMPAEKDIQDMLNSRAGDKFSNYSFSWQKGVEGDYGHQGYHGLKGEMYDNFIRLGAMEDVRMSLKRVPEKEGSYYVLMSSVIAPRDGHYDLLTGNPAPVLLLVNKQKIDPGTSGIDLRKGSNEMLAVYNTACETYLIFRDNTVPFPARQAVSMRWFHDKGVLPFAVPGQESSGLFAFESAPGLTSLSFEAYGKVNAWIAGKKADVKILSEEEGLRKYSVETAVWQSESTQVVIRIDYQPGYAGGAAIPGKIREECKTGEISLGDWSQIDGLRSYSGGAWYRKNISLTNDDLKKDLEIDLGDLVCSAELFINGKSTGIRPAPPYRFNISEYAQAGQNDIEVLVYNTLSNHYTTLPTRYRGDVKAGLMGPVKLLLTKKVDE